MESPIEVVRRFCAAWSDDAETAELAAFFTDDAVYDNIPVAPVTGRDNIAAFVASVIRPGPPGIERIDFRDVNIAANGPIVMTERVDVFKVADRSFELQRDWARSDTVADVVDIVLTTRISKPEAA